MTCILCVVCLPDGQSNSADSRTAVRNIDVVSALRTGTSPAYPDGPMTTLGRSRAIDCMLVPRWDCRGVCTYMHVLVEP